VKRQLHCYGSFYSRRNRLCVGGFTLLELLVAIMILGLMMTVAFGAVRMGGRSWEAGISRAKVSEEVRTVSDFLRRQFAQMIPRSEGNDGMPQAAFAGDRNRIWFIAPAPRHPAVGGLLVYTLIAEGYADAQRLVLAYSQLDPGASEIVEAETDQRLVLAEGLAKLSFDYFGTQAADSIPSWHEEWSEEEDNLPELVRITMVAAGDADRWPELLLKTRAQGNRDDQ